MNAINEAEIALSINFHATKTVNWGDLDILVNLEMWFSTYFTVF